MEVYGNKPPENHDVYIKTQKAGKTDQVSEKSSAGGAGTTDKVDLSDKAKKIAELKNTINQLPEIRSDKIQAIEKAIADGTYKIDPQKIAGRLIDELV